MEIRVLRYFLAVVREESISRAAEVLHITQPTLSRQIAQMEEEMGVKLFDRSARRIALTPEGVLLRRRAREILSLVDKTEEELSHLDRFVEGKIAIGCGEIAGVELLARLLDAFHEAYPLVRFDLQTANDDLVREQMERGLMDVGLLLEPVDVEKYQFIRLNVRERWVVLMRPDDPLAAKEAITAAELAHLPLILPRRATVRSELASWFGKDYDALNVLFTSNLSTNAALMVRQGLGHAVVIEGSVPLWDREKIACRPLSPALTATSVLAWRRAQPFSVAATRFIEHATAFLRAEAPDT